MLPASPRKTIYDGAPSVEEKIKPGSWWRLASEDHPLSEGPAPDHGLILMVQEVRVIDGEIHTIVLHPHPIWRGHAPAGLKMLLEDFLRNFTPEPDGENLREIEIAAVMARVQEISVEMKTPPDPILLLERQKEKETAKAAASVPQSDSDEAGLPAVTGETEVPAALLPSRDVVEAQRAIENRIAAFEAQKNWITGKTNELKGEMDLVAGYQMEKVNTTLASISEETSRAESLLQNVQTMRLFLGEDMSVTPLLDGKGADADEPLTLMQRMLFLDEEIVINDLLEGFSDDHMDPENLTDLFSKDFSLVERMLPYPRCAAIVRVRRNHREFNTDGLSIVELFGLIEVAQADMRVHILVRDGERLNMITADETTSGAERFFPSRSEIDALFKTRSYFGRESTEILPDNVEYSDARAEHDKRALFYKRFLILMWGVHERTDTFGPFMEKGANWLSLTTHSERFRFIHDEEEVLTDGRPMIGAYVDAANAAMGPGSRVLAYWNKTIDGTNAPALASESDYRRQWKFGVDVAEPISLSFVQVDGANLVARAPAKRSGYRVKERQFEAKVVVKRPLPAREGRPDTLLSAWVAEGLLCLDRVTLEDIDYYANSRAARASYLQYAHLLTKAREILRAEAQIAGDLLDGLRDAGHDFDEAAMQRALPLWRAANKWGWPEKETQVKVLLKLAERFKDEAAIKALIKSQPDMLWGGLRANGDVFVICDSLNAALPDGTALPWLEERVISNIQTGAVKRRSTRSWVEDEKISELTLVQCNKARAQFLSRCAPSQTITLSWKDEQLTIDAWRCPRGLFDTANEAALADTVANTATADLVRGLVDNEDPEVMREWLRQVFASYRAPKNRVELQTLKGSLAFAWAVDYDLMPRAWVIDVEIDMLELAAMHGEEELLLEQMKRVYAQPQKVLRRTMADPRPVRIFARRLGLQSNLAKKWQATPCLSFEEIEARLMCYEDHLRGNPDIGWKDALASTFAKKDERFGKSPFEYRGASLDSIQDAASRIGVMMSPASEAILPRLYEMSRKG